LLQQASHLEDVNDARRRLSDHETPSHIGGVSGQLNQCADARRVDGLAPNSIKIPSLDVTATIGQATLINGVLTPPRVPTEVGAWAGSASLNANTGEVTLAGHVNWASMAPFAFAKLAYLHTGDLVYTTDGHSNQTAWRITAVTARSKNDGIDPTAFAGMKGPRTLALITCGGDFDSADDSYHDNIYVTAQPVPMT
jgi:hypothetical protein